MIPHSWLHDTNLSGVLSTTPEFLLQTAIPLVLCVVLVHLFFRHFMSIAWLSVKSLIAAVVYIHVRGLVTSYAQSSDAFCLESTVFGLPPGSINIAASLGFRVIRSRVFAAISATCPSCVSAPTTEPSSPWVEWMGNTLHI